MIFGYNAKLGSRSTSNLLDYKLQLTQALVRLREDEVCAASPNFDRDERRAELCAKDEQATFNFHMPFFWRPYRGKGESRICFIVYAFGVVAYGCFVLHTLPVTPHESDQSSIFLVTLCRTKVSG